MPTGQQANLEASSQRGFFLTFEGLDGSGKTTQIELLKAWLIEQHLPFVLTRQPGGTRIGDSIRQMLLNSDSTGLASRTELAMMFADRAQTIHEVIGPALAAGKILVCDRFTDSTEAYQGGGRQLGSDLVLKMHRLICENLQPDLTILLTPSVSASLNRARHRNEQAVIQTGSNENRFEREQDAFFERVSGKYHEIAERESLRVVVVDGDLSIDQVHQQVKKAVAARLETKNLIPMSR